MILITWWLFFWSEVLLLNSHVWLSFFNLENNSILRAVSLVRNALVYLVIQNINFQGGKQCVMRRVQTKGVDPCGWLWVSHPAGGSREHMPWAVLGACVHALSLRKGSYRTKLFHDDQEMYDEKLLSAKAAQLMHEVRIEWECHCFANTRVLMI